MGNPYAPAQKNEPNVYDSSPSFNPTPDPEEWYPTPEEPETPSPEPTPEPGPGPNPEDGEILIPPTGTISEVTDWVGEDVDRAKAALEAEKNGANRKTLITTLEGIIGVGSN